MNGPRERAAPPIGNFLKESKMAVPKRKSSKAKIRSRRAAHKGRLPGVKPCPGCGAPQQPHRVCPSCGSYKGRQVVSVEAE